MPLEARAGAGQIFEILALKPRSKPDKNEGLEPGYLGPGSGQKCRLSWSVLTSYLTLFLLACVRASGNTILQIRYSSEALAIQSQSQFFSASPRHHITPPSGVRTMPPEALDVDAPFIPSDWIGKKKEYLTEHLPIAVESRFRFSRISMRYKPSNSHIPPIQFLCLLSAPARLFPTGIELTQEDVARFKTLAGGLGKFNEAMKLFRKRGKKKVAAGGESGDDGGEDSE
ncbi:hypothetical protein K438DRAFT_1757802 [Mycena galopus ATCC 62051]|nr:hypothetical protein K438DRAFT_1757802 [Mycena galopus ATCC 62051]